MAGNKKDRAYFISAGAGKFKTDDQPTQQTFEDLTASALFFTDNPAKESDGVPATEIANVGYCVVNPGTIPSDFVQAEIPGYPTVDVPLVVVPSQIAKMTVYGEWTEIQNVAGFAFFSYSNPVVTGFDKGQYRTVSTFDSAGVEHKAIQLKGYLYSNNAAKLPFSVISSNSPANFIPANERYIQAMALTSSTVAPSLTIDNMYPVSLLIRPNGVIVISHNATLSVGGTLDTKHTILLSLNNITFEI